MSFFLHFFPCVFLANAIEYRFKQTKDPKNVYCPFQCSIAPLCHFLEQFHDCHKCRFRFCQTFIDFATSSNCYAFFFSFPLLLHFFILFVVVKKKSFFSFPLLFIYFDRNSMSVFLLHSMQLLCRLIAHAALNTNIRQSCRQTKEFPKSVFKKFFFSFVSFIQDLFSSLLFLISFCVFLFLFVFFSKCGAAFCVYASI